MFVEHRRPRKAVETADTLGWRSSSHLISGCAARLNKPQNVGFRCDTSCAQQRPADFWEAPTCIPLTLQWSLTKPCSQNQSTPDLAYGPKCVQACCKIIHCELNILVHLIPFFAFTKPSSTLGMVPQKVTIAKMWRGKGSLLPCVSQQQEKS